MSRRAKIGFGFLGFIFVASVIFNGVFLLVYWVDTEVGPAGREQRAMRVVEGLDEATQAGVLTQFNVSDVEIVGKPRMMTVRDIDGVKHRLIIVGSDDWYVELYFIDQGQLFEGEVYAAHHVRVGCCSEGEDRWWVADPELLAAYVTNQ